jgi:predicted RNA-binding protein with PIN domain
MYLIDGNNLIGHTKSISYKDPQARQQVLNRIAKFLESRHRKATVVFDGTAEHLRKTRWIQLVFSGPGRTADDLIRRQVEGTRSRKGLCVVSSDNGIYGYARSCGVEALKCHEFNHLLNEELVAGAEPEKRDVPVDSIKHWMRYFGEEDDGGDS